jgi:hypothetical protein
VSDTTLFTMDTRLRDYAGGDHQFYRWLQKVNTHILAATGNWTNLSDLVDYPLRDAYDAGEDPADTARAVLTNAGMDSDGEDDED